jgi:hypothetical protein
MTRPMVSILNAETQELITREMNDAEYAQHEIDKAAWEAKQASVSAE